MGIVRRLEQEEGWTPHQIREFFLEEFGIDLLFDDEDEVDGFYEEGDNEEAQEKEDQKEDEEGEEVKRHDDEYDDDEEYEDEDEDEYDEDEMYRPYMPMKRHMKYFYPEEEEEESTM